MQQQTKKCVKLYASLDAFWDTWLGTLIKKNASLATQVIQNGYYSDTSYKFDNALIGVDFVDIDDQYQLRDKVTLVNSPRTNLVVIILDIISEVKLNKEDVSEDLTLQLFLNVNRYGPLSNNERDVIREGFEILTEGLIEVYFVDVSDSLVSLGYLGDNYHYAFLADFIGFVKLHGEKFIEHKKPSLRIIAPRVALEGNLEDTDGLKVEGDDIAGIKCGTIEIAIRMFFDLTLVERKFFQAISLNQAPQQK